MGGEESGGTPKSRVRGIVGAWLCCLLCGALLAPERAAAYAFTGSRWVTTPIVMQLQLGSTSAPLADGSASWAASAESALALWNSNIEGAKFSAVRDSTAPKGEANRTNNVFFSADVYGDAWGSGVLAVTVSYSTGTQTVESDVLFNTQHSWNSYRGPQQFSSTGMAVFDFHRVALHEFGHVLGLDHPDTAGQSVTALMNSRIGNLDTLAADDVGGAQFLYGAASTPVAPPQITTQPVSQGAVAGQDVSFTVAATSTVAMTYQWMKAGVPIGGATQSTLTLVGVTTSTAGSYSVRVTNSAGSVTSSPATLTVSNSTVVSPPPVSPPPAPTPLPVIAPALLSQPASQSVALGARVSFSAAATGTAPLGYQWRKSGTAIAGATASVFVVPSAQASDAGSYTVVVSNAAGSITSSAATLTVQAAPVIATAPASQTVVAGRPLVLSVVASGSPAPTYQWSKDGTPIAGATHDVFSVAAAQPSDAGAYRVTVANAAGSLASASAQITVVIPPAIVTPPSAQTAKAGSRVELGVTATGTPNLAYQWTRNGTPVAGATAAQWVIARAQPSDDGTYAVVVTNSAGSVTSAGARITVNFSRLVNLSTRGFIPPGGALTPGFVVRGAGTKELLVRGIGPALGMFGLEEALAAPMLQLAPVGAATTVSAQAGEPVASVAELAAKVGAFPIPPGSNDAVTRAALASGSYTVRISPAEVSGSGIALAELYDADDVSSSSRLVNASTLGFVGSGAHALMPGFVIRGNAPKRLLVRAIGPGLQAFGVGGVLADPRLAIIPLGGAAETAANDDWNGADVERAFADAGAFALESGSKDAAVVVELPPGGYTVVITGADGTVGTALVELYDLDP